MQAHCTVCLILLLFVVELVIGRSDLETLLEVKKGFKEDHSGKVLNSWDSKSLKADGCPRNWYGITCSEGHVTSIVLNGVGLIGKLDFPAISSLKMLRNLSVANNQLRGNVTGLFAQLGGILFVDISGNKLFGSLDLETRKGYSSFVSKVKYLNISHNNMSGELFPHGGMPSFDSLEVFDASYNMFVGKLPSFNFVASLQILRLGNNKLSGSPPQGLLQQSSMILFELDVSHNELEDKNPRTQNALSLTDRLKIAVDVARCLCYLHHEIAIPHGNLKSTNVLVGTSTANTVLTDYSLHRIMTSAGTSEQILTAAALGYRPPEFASMSKPCPSLKSDVYAFGVILLELLTGKSASGIVPGMVDLTEWVRSLAALNRSLECFDPFVVGVRSADRVYVVLDAMLHVALSCIFPADERPDMRVIFEELSSLSVEDTTLQIVK
ncbi:unnamed protein product [Cuscuta epithymum]|uniref:Protein kinase domain-containing protein n=1 Tax=Cuscuta epithymum TaxID=186058 RepID=A0AAV0E3U0_9ASTE|nr:unnamed protein product [Cuscuta epithymum]